MRRRLVDLAYGPLLVSLGIVIVQVIRAIETGLRCSLPRGFEHSNCGRVSRQAWNIRGIMYGES